MSETSKTLKFKTIGTNIKTVRSYYDNLTILDLRGDISLGDYVHIDTNSYFGSIEKELLTGIGETEVDKKLIVTTHFLDKIEIVVENISKGTKVDILLVDSNCDFDKYREELHALVESGLVGEIGVSKPDSVKRLEELKSIIGNLNFISLDICPLNFEYDVINWCEENDVNIIGFNILGDNLTRGNLIQSFSLSYLLNFAANYCSIIIIDAVDDTNNIFGFDTYEFWKYLSELVDKPSDPKYILKKNVHKLNKPVKKTIHTALCIENSGLVLPFDEPDSLFSVSEILTSLTEIKPEFNSNVELSEEETGFRESIYEIYNTLSKPEDGDNRSSVMALLIPKIVNRLKQFYAESNKDETEQRTFWVNIDSFSNICIFKYSVINELPKKWFKKRGVEVKEINYIMYFDGNEFYFNKLNLNN